MYHIINIQCYYYKVYFKTSYNFLRTISFKMFSFDFMKIITKYRKSELILAYFNSKTK